MRASRIIDQYSEAVTQGRSTKIIILKNLTEKHLYQNHFFYTFGGSWPEGKRKKQQPGVF